MARAPETGFYFEPLAERLALVVDGAPFPSDDHWALIGDPIEMTPELAKLTCALRWPGIDPEALEVELNFDVERALAELQKAEEEKAAGLVRAPEEYSFDMDEFLRQMQELRAAAESMKVAVPDASELEQELERAEAARREADGAGTGDGDGAGTGDGDGAGTGAGEDEPG